jgi:5-methyltetrahydrofolate--homocysteine methyltransferase
MDALTDPEKRSVLLERINQEANAELDRKFDRPASASPGSSVMAANPINLPSGVAWGARLVRSMPLEIVFKYLYKPELFRLSWGAKNTHGEEWTRLQAEFEDRLQRMQRQALREAWLQPQGVYGYWPCQADGEDLIIYNPLEFGTAGKAETRVPGGLASELMRFHFPPARWRAFVPGDYFAQVARARSMWWHFRWSRWASRPPTG